jgi:hypothetical protein
MRDAILRSPGANSSWRWRHGIPGISETLIAKALYPYPAGRVVATKGGLTRPGANRWVTDCRAFAPRLCGQPEKVEARAHRGRRKW